MQQVRRSVSLSVWGLLVLAMLATLALVVQPKSLLGDDAKAKSDKEQLQGTWMGEAPHDPASTAPAEKVTIAFDGDKVYQVKDGNRRDAASFKVNPDKTPKEIDVVPDSGGDAGQTVKGIYEINGDKLKIAFGEENRPAEFAANLTITFTRQK